MSQFAFDLKLFNPSTGMMLLRDYATTTIAGAVKLDGGFTSKGTTAIVIALSVRSIRTVDPDAMIADVLSNMRDASSISRLCGCICSHEDEKRNAQTHELACPNHPDFWDPDRPWNTMSDIYNHRLIGMNGIASQAFMNHVLNMSEIDGFLNPSWNGWESYTLNVMLVAPRPVQHGTTMVYERLGIGEIYLKKWFEADRKFETLVIV